MFDKAKLEALRAKYTGIKETEVAPAEFRKALSLVFGRDYRRAMPYAGLSSLLDLPYRPEAPDLPDLVCWYGRACVLATNVPLPKARPASKPCLPSWSPARRQA